MLERDDGEGKRLRESEKGEGIKYLNCTSSIVQ